MSCRCEVRPCVKNSASVRTARFVPSGRFLISIFSWSWSVRFLSFWLVLCSCSYGLALPFQEVRSREIGPRSERPLRGFNVNHFEWSKAPLETPDCQSLSRRPQVCGDKMVLVCSTYFRTALCMDQDLYVDSRTGRPQGNMNLFDCQAACASQGKRLPTNNEWQVGCTGTRPDDCLVYHGPHPGELYARVPGHVCERDGAYSSRCLMSPDLVAMLPETPKQCVSEAGVRACVGTFEQWVSNHFVAGQYYRFNGGMFALPASAVDYVTPAHPNDFRHYASGCRCATDPRIR